jgi:CheY-like chemotaxis protein
MDYPERNDMDKPPAALPRRSSSKSPFEKPASSSSKSPFEKKAACPRLLIIDDNPDGRFLIAKTVMRKFQHAVILECQTADAAFTALAAGGIAAVISHRTYDAEGTELIREIRQRDPHVPIIMMSAIDRHEDAIAAGANAFLTYDQWLLVGSTLSTLLRVPAARLAKI